MSVGYGTSRASWEELAHRAGVHGTYLGAVECAEVNGSIDNIAPISMAVGVKAADLVMGGGLRLSAIARLRLNLNG
jgi:hypothetical protein